eukprot:4204895-Heterocapsa_arctica.AAC.1
MPLHRKVGVGDSRPVACLPHDCGDPLELVDVDEEALDLQAATEAVPRSQLACSRRCRVPGELERSCLSYRASSTKASVSMMRFALPLLPL